MANISVSGTLCKGNDKHEAIVARTINTQQGQKTMTTFKVAVYQGKDKDGNSQYGYWKVTAFGILADNICKELKAGDRVIVTGQPKIETWTVTAKNASYDPEAQQYCDRQEIHTQPTIIAQAVGREINPFPPRNSNGYGNSYNQPQDYQNAERQAQAAINAVRPQSMQEEEFPMDFSSMPTDGSEVEIPF